MNSTNFAIKIGNFVTIAAMYAACCAANAETIAFPDLSVPSAEIETGGCNKAKISEFKDLEKKYPEGNHRVSMPSIVGNPNNFCFPLLKKNFPE